MAIPVEHLKRLEADLSTHESWLTTLRRQIEGLEAEASAHEMMLRLGRDPELRRVLGELHDQPELGERIAADPRSCHQDTVNYGARPRTSSADRRHPAS